MKRQNKEAFQTLTDLWVGIGLYFLILEVVGLIFTKNRVSYTLGLLAGCATAAFLAWHMYRSIDVALDLGEEDAPKYSGKNCMIRTLVMIAVAIAGIKLSIFSFPAVILGIFGLKIAAFTQPLIHSHITKKLLDKKGR